MKTIRKNDLNLKNQNGFTLIELVIVILITGIILTLIGTVIISFTKKTQISQTEFKLEEIKGAMTRYLSVNGRYPCASDRTLTPIDANFGREVTDVCDTGAFSGTSRNSGVRIGAVPTRTLSLPDEFSGDAWGRKFTYAVTESLATQNTPTTTDYTDNGGLISIVDGADLSLVTPDDTAHFVIVSHGPTGAGGFSMEGSTRMSVCETARLEGENCDDSDNIFRSTLVTSDANTNDFFDDFLIFKGQTAPVFFVEPCTVMAFNRDSCPDSWSEYTKAEGRFVIGRSTTNYTGPRYNSEPTVPPQTANLDINVGQTGNDSEANIPPYAALLYCQKEPTTTCLP